jgi:hypothetical protein
MHAPDLTLTESLTLLTPNEIRNNRIIKQYAELSFASCDDDNKVNVITLIAHLAMVGDIGFRRLLEDALTDANSLVRESARGWLKRVSED